MGLPVTVYRWDDEGAPQITTGSVSQCLDVLQKCLVDGYGNKSSLGWTLEYSGDDIFAKVFKNSPVEGNGIYAKFWSKDELDSGQRIVRMQTCKSMTDIDTMIMPGIYHAFQTLRNNSVTKWVIIGTSRCFYLFLMPQEVSWVNHYQIQNSCAFIGEIQGSITGDTALYCVVSESNNSSNDSFAWQDNLSALNISKTLNIGKMYASNGDTGSLNYRLETYFDVPSNRTGFEGELPASANFSEVVVRAQFTVTSTQYLDSEGTPYSRSDIQPFIKGTMPGLIQSSTPAFEKSPWPCIKNIGNDDYFVVGNPYSTGGSSFFINLREWS